MWSSKSLGSRLKYGFFQYLAKLGLGSIARVFIFPISLYYSIKPKSRNLARHYLRRRFPAASSFELFRHTVRLYYNFANGLYDRILLGCGLPVPMAHDRKTLEKLKEILEDGKGCILVGAHIGVWQNGLAGLDELQRPIGVLFWMEETMEHDFFNYAKDINIINANGGVGSAIRMRNILKQNGILCIMGDRMTPGDREYAKVKFLGGEICVPMFPYLLSRRTGAPVVHSTSVRKKGVTTGLPAVVNRDLENAPEIFAEFMENLVEQYPHHFFNFYDIWDIGNEQGRDYKQSERAYYPGSIQGKPETR